MADAKAGCLADDIIISLVMPVGRVAWKRELCFSSVSIWSIGKG